jgi:alkanesulfonate monooxygenase SsuD/methylene tetrahydromethanopterin reductase-like flavin-dependent oxidoreductase (luciferase family)
VAIRLGGWFEPEHRALGFEFGTVADRFNRVEEALQIIQPMIKGGVITTAAEALRPLVGM